jgi:hypothetical protein
MIPMNALKQAPPVPKDHMMIDLGEWFHSGRIIDLIVCVTLSEAGILTLLYRWRHQGVPPWEFLINLASGLCLMLALRAALQQAPWTWIALWLFLSGAAHIGDLTRRWRR